MRKITIGALNRAVNPAISVYKRLYKNAGKTHHFNGGMIGGKD